MKIAVSRQDYIFSFPAIVCSSRRGAPTPAGPPCTAAAPRAPAGNAGRLLGGCWAATGPAWQRPGSPGCRGHQSIGKKSRCSRGKHLSLLGVGGEGQSPAPAAQFPVLSPQRYGDTLNPVMKHFFCFRTIWHCCCRAREPVVPERDHATGQGRREGDLQP